MILTVERKEELTKVTYCCGPHKVGQRLQQLAELIDEYGHFEHGSDGGQVIQEIWLVGDQLHKRYLYGAEREGKKTKQYVLLVFGKLNAVENDLITVEIFDNLNDLILKVLDYHSGIAKEIKDDKDVLEGDNDSGYNNYDTDHYQFIVWTGSGDMQT